VTIRAWQPTLRAAAAAWLDQADQLRGAERNLEQAEVSELGPRVAGPAGRFVRAWAAELAELRGQAQSHAAAVDEASRQLFAVDRETVAEVQRLVPWADRDVTPVRSVR
jgi:hypothetical protein